MNNLNAVPQGKKHIPNPRLTECLIQGSQGRARNIQHPDLLTQGFITILQIHVAQVILTEHLKDQITGVIQLQADLTAETTVSLQGLQTGVSVLHQDQIAGVTALLQGLQTGVTVVLQDLQAAEVILHLQGLQAPNHQEAAPEAAVPHQAGVEDNLS